MRLRDFFQPHFLCLNPCKKNAKWQCVSNAVSLCPAGTLPRSPQLRFARLAHKKNAKCSRKAVLRCAQRAHSPVRLNFALLVWLTKKSAKCGGSLRAPQAHYFLLSSKKNAKCSRKAVLRHRSLWKRGAGKEPFYRKGFPRLTSYTRVSSSSRAASNSSLNCSAFAVERLSSPMTVKSILSS